jgi:hypothetical protein
MSKRNLTLAALTAALLLVAGGLYASNMGFKLNYQMDAGLTGTNTIALPFNQMTGLTDAKDLIDDINATGSPTGQVVNIQQWDPTADALTTYAGAPTDPPAFLLNKGEAYFAKVGATTDYVIVGSHDPAKVLTLVAGLTGTNFFAPPYHKTVVDAKDLIDEINANGNPTGQVVNIQQWDPATDALTTYAGAPTDPPAFLLPVGEGVYVKVGAGITYTPSHF